MKVSVVIPVLNDKRVANALDSVISQEFDEEIEIVVVDGGSTDGTLDVLERYRPYLSVFISEPDRGLYDAMNKGVRAASGDIVAILNVDDRYQDSRVFQDVAKAIDTRNVDGCYGDVLFVGDNNKVVRYWKAGRYARTKLYLGFQPPHQTLFLRKSIYNKYGLYNDRYRIAADYEFELRLLYKYNVKLIYIERPLVRMGLGGKSHKSWPQGLLECYQAWRENKFCFPYLVPVGKMIRARTWPFRAWLYNIRRKEAKQE